MSGMLMDERFVAVFPSLVRLLGNLESAVILQHIHWAADDQGQCRITRQQISDETGITFATVTRRLAALRDGGWLSSERSSAADSTQVYRVNVEQIRECDPRQSQSATPGNRSVDTSESRSLQLSSLQKEEVPTSSQVDTSPAAHTSDLPDRPKHAEPQRHPSRPIDSWTPSGTLLRYLSEAYRHVDVNSCYTRFRNFHYAKQDTSKSWDALFENWVSNDEDRAVANQLGGTDELGRPLSQRGTSSVVGPALQPGDEGYFDAHAYLAEHPLNG